MHPAALAVPAGDDQLAGHHEGADELNPQYAPAGHTEHTVEPGVATPVMTGSYVLPLEMPNLRRGGDGGGG